MEKLIDLIFSAAQENHWIAFIIIGVVLLVMLTATALLAFLVVKSDSKVTLGPLKFERKLKQAPKESNSNNRQNVKYSHDFQDKKTPPLKSTHTGSLREKIIDIQRKQIANEIPFVLIGSTYIDLILLPISVRELRDEEWSDLDTPKVTIGGSAMCVGRYLWVDYGIRSNLMTPISNKEDIFSMEFRRLIQKEAETWLIPDNLIHTDSSPTPVTVILKQLDKNFTSMFTYRGALSSFGWRDVSNTSRQMLSNGGILYLSGFTKTNLSDGLVDNLSEFNEKSLVVLDHGRINLRTDNPSALRSIMDAFSSGCIDILICTLREITDFFHAVTGRSRECNLDDAREILEDIATTEVLPAITIVRTNIGDQSISAYSIVSGIVDPIPDHSRRFFDGTPVAPLNAFNASILSGFALEPLDPSSDLRDYVISLCQKSLAACHKTRKNDPSKI